MLDVYFPLYILIFFSTLILTAVFEKKLIPRLTENAKQPIYTEGPRWHAKKSGTPTMGGLAFLLASSVALIIASLFGLLKISGEVGLSVIICLFYAILNSLVGICDDLKKLRKKQNAGLTPVEKLIMQTLAAMLFLFLRQLVFKDGTAISFSFGSIDLGIFYYPLALLILVGIVNCANLTDGIDGLASSVAFAVGVSLFYISAALSIDGAIVSSAIMGAAIGFLLFNIHPARIFMGDTGSLFFGALIASSAFTLHNPFIIIPIAGVYALEGLSVILQVVYFKATKKRLFKMAPFHHHLERCGWSENKICITAILSTLLFSLPVYIFYLP